MRSIVLAWRAEKVKALAAREWLTWGLAIFISSLGLSALMGVLIISATVEDLHRMVHEEDVVRSIYSSPLPVCYLIALSAGINLYAGERKRGSLPMVLLIVPRRIHAILAKYVLGMVLGIWFGIVYVVGVLIGGGSTLFVNERSLVPTLGVVRTLIVMITLFALWCAFGVGLGMTLPLLTALLTGFALAIVLPLALSTILSGTSWGRNVITLFPGVATNLSTEPEMGAFADVWLPWWGSYAVLILWVLLIALLGAHSVIRSQIAVD